LRLRVPRGQPHSTTPLLALAAPKMWWA
jgi:hypothetical protein